MAEDRSGHEVVYRSWIEKIADAFSPEPRSRRDLLQALRSAADSEVIDRDAQSIMEGALRVGDMQVREIMVPRPQMQVVRVDAAPAELLHRHTEHAHSRRPLRGENTD